ncbi:histidine phosphatase family protein [Streptomyces sp. NBC_00306]|uniref:histidine phosphatase family protein n=1 Tax=Streptomyces sp. NBC_00306 TaxID=2975708 RepID=UPI002E2A45E3|nr:histidine phosphatase family protein [Streptomyces sp. NBC_00306]
MTVTLTFLCATAPAPLTDTRLGDGPRSKRAVRAAAAAIAALPPHSLAVRAPSTRCALTAYSLGLDTTPEPGLRDLDYGKWYGSTVGDVVADDPFGLSAWLTDPDATPHGGESVRELCRRTAHWLSSVPSDAGHVLAVTEPAIIRASLVHAMAAPARAFWHLDVPSSVLSLTSRGDRWSWSTRLGYIAPVQRWPSDVERSPADRIDRDESLVSLRS